MESSSASVWVRLWEIDGALLRPVWWFLVSFFLKKNGIVFKGYCWGFAGVVMIVLGMGVSSD